MCTLSIVTPTFNRAGYLDRCYQSLLKQTCFDFEWILVDDGSTDNTAEVVSAFQPHKFRLCYIRKENGGKHTALNAAHDRIHGLYVLILDSDDRLTETAVKEVLAAWSRFAQDEKVGIVTFLMGTDQDHPVCTVKDYDVPVEIMRYRRKRYIRTDCCDVFRAELFKEYPFPVFEGEKFIAECALWDRISFTHKRVYEQSIIYICEYLEGGLTKQGRGMRLRNPHGGMFTSDLRMDRSNFLRERVKNGLLHTCYAKAAGISFGEMVRKSRSPYLAALCSPFGTILYYYWKRKTLN